MAVRVKRRSPWIAVIGAAAVIPLVAFALVVYFFPDPAPNEFMVGAAPDGDAAVVLYIGDCVGGQLEHVGLAVDAEEGFDPTDTELWSIVAEGAGYSLSSEEVIEVEPGAPFEGMVETTALRGELPQGDTLQVDVDTSVQSFGFFFTLDDLEEGKIWAGGHGLVSPDRFRSLVRDLCD